MTQTVPSTQVTNFGASRCARRTTSKLSNILLILAIIYAALSLTGPMASAQTAHSAAVSWSAPSDAISSSTYNVYRAPGACPASGLGTLTFVKLNATPITGLSYTDTTITVGSWCFYGTQVQNGVESAPSNTAGGNVSPNAPTITVVLK